MLNKKLIFQKLSFKFRMASSTSTANYVCFTKYDKIKLKCIDIGANLSGLDF